MSKTEKEYFDLSIAQLQALGAWAADCAERSLTLYENIEQDDARPRRAIEGIRAFVASGKRTNALRKASLEAFRASSETKDLAASAAAKAASLAAASAFTHPFKDLRQAMHILGPASYSALAVELRNTATGQAEIEWAVANADESVADLLKKMPEQSGKGKRIDQLLQMLDQGIREKFK
ncbi:hypothetical protein SAMN05216327_113139 [Dyadobacter sp. SG02]|uniref:putative immunity protein n=1 Tax=Dyadobacter sp. SG02 TaxID=1855291 RepID=UPI0008CD3557|nr:hypothetical protein [Dyadobacter sp. SG02]SEJ59356.1 hypothetical protein SAMN05216327_113139 [Dyadobacter sp. SG02]